MRVELRPHNSHQDELVVDGQLVGYAVRARWDLGVGPPLRLGNTLTGHTVSTDGDTEDLIAALAQKSAEVDRAGTVDRAEAGR